MTRDDILKLALQAGFDVSPFTGGSRSGTMSIFDSGNVDIYYALQSFASLVAAQERAACIKIAESELSNGSMLLSNPPKSGAAWEIRGKILRRDSK